MGRFQQAAAVLLALFLLALAGCAQLKDQSSPEPSLPEVTAPAETEPVSPEEAAKLDRLADIYESCFDGGSLSDGDSAYSGGLMALDFLYREGLLDTYQNQDAQGWTIPLRVLGEVDQLFFSHLEPFSERQLELVERFDEATLVPPVLSLVREGEVQRLEDGTLSATYRRVKGEDILIPVTYRFQPFPLEEVPEGLKEAYQPGDTFYRLFSVTQREDLLPEVQPQTIEIATAEELLAAAERINQGGYSSYWDTYLLTADIDLAGVDWTPMGLNSRAIDYYQTWRDPTPLGFEGTFDGQGHTIRGLTITQEQGSALLEEMSHEYRSTDINGVGFFLRVGSQGVVKDLRLENASVSLPLSNGERSGPAALMAVYCTGRMENVSVQGRVQGLFDVGGLVGSLSALGDDPGRLERCTADVEVVGYSTIGGLVGMVRSGSLTDCTAQGSVTAADVEGLAEEPLAPGLAGGLMGWSWNGRTVGCGSSAEVVSEVFVPSIGSFCGYWEGGSARGCWVDGGKNTGQKPVGETFVDPPYPLEIEERQASAP